MFRKITFIILLCHLRYFIRYSDDLDYKGDDKMFIIIF